MAPVDHDELEQQLKDIIQSFYQVMVQVSAYDTANRPSKEVLANELKSLSSALQTVHHTSTTVPTTAAPASSASHALHLPAQQPTTSVAVGGAAAAQIPPELIQYVDAGRNPDIYTREFVELVRRGNQLMRGKMGAFAAFRDVLAETVAAGMPELGGDVAGVLANTGGDEGAVLGTATESGSGSGAGAGAGLASESTSQAADGPAVAANAAAAAGIKPEPA